MNIQQANNKNFAPNKRKYEGWVPPAKKHHPSSGQQDERLRLGTTTEEPLTNGNLPKLPEITDEYAGQVFTHSSALPSKQSATGKGSYDRLEFLGDAYIEIIATRLLWNQFKEQNAGKLSSIRELLVKNETLAHFTTSYGLDQRLKFGGERRTHEMAWTKIKGDVFEAYVAAVVLSDPVNGFETAEDWLTELWMPKLAKVDTKTNDLKMKEMLARKILAPGVKVSYVDERAPIIDKSRGNSTYFVGVYLDGWGWKNQHLGSGKGLNKIEAGNEAANKALANVPLIENIAAKRQEWLRDKEEAKLAKQAEIPKDDEE